MIEPTGQAGCTITLVGGVFTCAPNTTPAVQPVRSYNVLATNPGTNPLVWQVATIPNPSTLEVHRNGLLMAPVIDYNVNGVVITFTAAQGATSTDTILCSYVPVN